MQTERTHSMQENHNKLQNKPMPNRLQWQKIMPVKVWAINNL
jgi:hypothetical protein